MGHYVRNGLDEHLKYLRLNGRQIMPDTRSLGPVRSGISEENLLTKIYEMDINTHYIPKLPFTARGKCSFYPLSKKLLSRK